MPPSKPPIEISASSVFDLKAELAKSQEKYAKEKALAQSGHKVTRSRGKKDSQWLRQNQGVQARAARDVIELEDTQGPTIDQSRDALARKAKIYEKLKRKGEDSERYLVDFEQKRWDGSEESDSDGSDSEDDLSHGTARATEDDPIVEYTDEFGRTRTAPQSKVPKIRTPPPRSPSPQAIYTNDTYEFPTPIFDPEDRPVIEQNARKPPDTGPVGPQHYDATREIRTKGVGFYQFSASEEGRRQQMSELEQLRQETLEQRATHIDPKEKRRLELEKRKELLRAKRQKIKGEIAPSAEENAIVAKKNDRQEEEKDAFKVNEDSVSAFLKQMRSKTSS